MRPRTPYLPNVLMWCRNNRNSLSLGIISSLPPFPSLSFSVPLSLVPSLVSFHSSFSLSISLLLSTALCLSLLLLCIVALLLLRHHILKHRPQSLDLTEFIADLCTSSSVTLLIYPLILSQSQVHSCSVGASCGQRSSIQVFEQRKLWDTYSDNTFQAAIQRVHVLQHLF